MSFSYISEKGHLEIRKFTAPHLESPEGAEDTYYLELWVEDTWPARSCGFQDITGLCAVSCIFMAARVFRRLLE